MAWLFAISLFAILAYVTWNWEMLAKFVWSAVTGAHKVKVLVVVRPGQPWLELTAIGPILAGELVCKAQLLAGASGVLYNLDDPLLPYYGLLSVTTLEGGTFVFVRHVTPRTPPPAPWIPHIGPRTAKPTPKRNDDLIPSKTWQMREP
ncbi:hypothetical protein KFL_000220410 [Klebsormidium nitens]|uniref:Uncharacterized protein n=1 Tax=Klebsormidium nitens TaxID=105231 RepID=A0A1Y1HP78_KLENI|nr:hypothetical protein KFL_000220410 [Klebsormidium nitens]|eukprot:GAQ79009.1 hypothetical protein KFL_000220410 [Klebsormidium nitens]